MSSKNNFSTLTEEQKKAWFEKKGIKYVSKEEYKLQKEEEKKNMRKDKTAAFFRQVDKILSGNTKTNNNFKSLSEEQKKAWFEKKGIKYVSKEEYKLQKEEEAMMNEMVRIATRKRIVVEEEVDEENEAFMREIKEEIEQKSTKRGRVLFL